MNKNEDFLVEIHTEELPPKALLKLSDAFGQQIAERLQKSELAFAEIKTFATPRRLAVLVKALSAAQPDQIVERKGPALSAAFDADGKPTPACAGFARSCGVTPAELITIKNDQGEWVGYKQHVAGKSVVEVLPALVEQAATMLPIPKRMRWGDNDAQFTRPIHSVMMLYGDQVVSGTILGYTAGRVTRGHRFHAPEWMTIPHASLYESLLETEGHVIPDFAKRRNMIREQAKLLAAKNCGDKAYAYISSEDFLNEVTGLVEKPFALCGTFDMAFLALPVEVLISSMEDHQRYFPVYGGDNQLLPNFITISNIESADAARVVRGNERVLRARLSDAAFFYATDKKESLMQRVERLKGMVYQAKLGTLFDKTVRVSRLAAFIAGKMGASAEDAARAGMLAKADLTTSMVGEFPELQGVMGGYYASHDSEPPVVAQAIVEQYLPKFAGDRLPASAVGQALALADRLDTLLGAFGIHQIPTGDKDPYGLRRAALGVLRILIENEISLDLYGVFAQAAAGLGSMRSNAEAETQLMAFMQERLRAWYGEQGVPPDVFAAVAALGVANPTDMHRRIQAVQAFKKMSAAENLSVANKRVSNILSKYADAVEAKNIDPAYFENAAEAELARQLEAKSKVVEALSQLGKYDEVLLQLTELRKPIDDFFDQVMVMTEDKQRRENRILLLNKLRALFLQVADIALLQ